MRDIKFRGYNKNYGWGYGSLIITDNNPNNPLSRNRNFKQRYELCVYHPGDWNMGGWENIDVIPESIGQFTGIKDKNGKEIFEGDVVKCEDLICKVIYCIEPGSVGFIFESLEGRNIVFAITNLNQTPHYEIIGNVYQNPELLNV